MAPSAEMRPKVGCGVFVLSEKQPGRFLISFRKGGIGDSLAQLPGGHQEYGETWAQTAYRETLEEVGVRLRDISFVGVTDCIRREVGYHYTTVFMKGYIDYSQGNQEVRNMEPHKCTDWQWISWEELPPPEKMFFCLADFAAKGQPPNLFSET